MLRPRDLRLGKVRFQCLGFKFVKLLVMLFMNGPFEAVRYYEMPHVSLPSEICKNKNLGCKQINLPRAVFFPHTLLIVFLSDLLPLFPIGTKIKHEQ